MNKQAKEMAKDICSPRCFKGELGHCNPTKDCTVLKFAEKAVERGYRKESDVAKEILQMIDKIPTNEVNELNHLHLLKKAIAEKHCYYDELD